MSILPPQVIILDEITVWVVTAIGFTVLDFVVVAIVLISVVVGIDVVGTVDVLAVVNIKVVGDVAVVNVLEVASDVVVSMIDGYDSLMNKKWNSEVHRQIEIGI